MHVLINVSFILCKSKIFHLRATEIIFATLHGEKDEKYGVCPNFGVQIRAMENIFLFWFAGPLILPPVDPPAAHQCQKSGSPVYTYIQAFMPYESTEDPSNQPDSFHSPGPLNSPLNLFGPLRSLGLPHKTSNVVADAIRHLRPPP